MRRLLSVVLLSSVFLSLPAFAADSPPAQAAVAEEKISLTADQIRALVAVPAAPVAQPSKLLAIPDVPPVDPSTVPDPLVDASGYVGAVVKAVSTHNWWMLIPLLLIGAVAAVRKFGAGLWSGFFTTPRGGAVLAIVCALGGSLYLSLELGTKGAGPVLLMAGVIFVSAYPLFKLLNNLISNQGPVPPVPPNLPPQAQPAPVVVPVAPAPAVVADAAAAAEVAAKLAGGSTATSLIDEARK